MMRYIAHTIALVALVSACSSKNASEIDGKMRSPLISSLKDPDSAQFRNERIEKSGALCGEVNSKNSYGGYVGFKRYILLGPNASYIEDGGTLTTWSIEDRKAIDNEVSLIQLETMKYNSIHPHQPRGMPNEVETTGMATQRLFEAKWTLLCSKSPSEK